MAEDEEEWMEIYDETGRPLGLGRRTVIHTQGTLHKTVNVFVCNSRGDVLVQRRMPTKDVCPDMWDVSCAEHLKPKETYQEAALRGLYEELKITLCGPLTMAHDEHRHEIRLPEKGVWDREVQTCFLVHYDGSWEADHVEVAEARFVPLETLRRWVERSPTDFTPWFLVEFSHCFPAHGEADRR